MKDLDSSPLLAEVGQDLSLFCNYQVLITHLTKDDRVYDDQVMGDSLYSIKWYRDDSEFFRYIPKGLKMFTFVMIKTCNFVLYHRVPSLHYIPRCWTQH